MQSLRLMLLLLLTFGGAVQAADYRVETLTQELVYPWSLAFLPDGGMLVTERGGQLRRISAEGKLDPEPVKGVPPVLVNSQAGLFEIALDPEFASNQQLYLSYACGTLKANHTCLSRATLTADGLQDQQEIFRAQPAKAGTAHYGGRMAFLADQTLLLTIGEGFDYREQAQNLASHLGKIVRLQRDGSAPADNPFIADAAAKPEIYSFGHRNPQGIVYDVANQRVLSHEHGPRGGDELNLIQPGNNYGWPKVTYGMDYSGAVISPHQQLPGLTDPLTYWVPSNAPAGMALYAGEMFPQWQGSVLIAALAGRHVRRVTLEGEQVVAQEDLFGELGQRLRDVRVGPDGAIYLLTDSPQGQLLKVVAAD